MTRYFSVTGNDVVIGISEERFDGSISEDEIADYRFVSDNGEVIVSSDIYEEVFDAYSKSNEGTIRILY